jgi:hypothetical protein
MSGIHEGTINEVKGLRKCFKCGTIKAMEEGDICNCEEVDKALKRDKVLDFLLEERKWWEFWKAK